VFLFVVLVNSPRIPVTSPNLPNRIGEFLSNTDATLLLWAKTPMSPCGARNSHASCVKLTPKSPAAKRVVSLLAGLILDSLAHGF
jgi:hypothetical protein